MAGTREGGLGRTREGRSNWGKWERLKLASNTRMLDIMSCCYNKNSFLQQLTGLLPVYPRQRMQAAWSGLIREARKQRCVVEAASIPALHKTLRRLAESGDVATTKKLFRHEDRRWALQNTCILPCAAALQSALMAARRLSQHGSWEVSTAAWGSC